MKGYLSVRKYQISGMSPSGGSASLPGTAGFPTWSGSGGRGQSKESKEEKTMTFDEAVQAIQPGRYRHFKGNAYEAIGVAGHSETQEPKGSIAPSTEKAVYGRVRQICGMKQSSGTGRHISGFRRRKGDRDGESGWHAGGRAVDA